MPGPDAAKRGLRGAYAGAIRLGTPDMAEPYKDNQNDGIFIAHNRIVGNGGTNLAGAIGVFAGADNYEIVRNDICGNFSAEYGGGISHYGESPGGSIHHNRIYFNRSYDEGGGIMVAGYLMIGRRVRGHRSLVTYIALVYGAAMVTLWITLLVSGQPMLGLPLEAYGWMLALGLIPQLVGQVLTSSTRLKQVSSIW